MKKCLPLKRQGLYVGCVRLEELGTLSTDTASKLDVLGHDGDPLGVDCAQVGVLEETHQISLAGLLKIEIVCEDRKRL